MAQMLVTGPDGKPVWVESGVSTPVTGVVTSAGMAAPATPAAKASWAADMIKKAKDAAVGAYNALLPTVKAGGEAYLAKTVAESAAKNAQAQAALEKLKQQQGARPLAGGTKWLTYGGIALGVVAAVYLGGKLFKGRK